MNQATTRIAAGVIAILLASNLSDAHAQSTASGSTTPTMGQFFSNLNPMNWQMPQMKMPDFRSMLPGQEEKTRIIQKKDGLMNDVKTTASNSWQKTKEVLDPKKLNPMNLFPASPTPTTTSGTQQPGFFSSLFAPGKPVQQEPQEIATVGDFLAQPKLDR